MSKQCKRGAWPGSRDTLNANRFKMATWTGGLSHGRRSVLKVARVRRLNVRVMETAGKAFYGGMECACKGNSVQTTRTGNDG